jgi:hypothetical protein
MTLRRDPAHERARRTPVGMTTDANGNLHTSPGTTDGGKFAVKPTAENSASALTRTLVRSTPGQQMQRGMKALKMRADAVQIRTDMQTTLTAMRAAQQQLDRIEVDEDGQGDLVIVGAWANDGTDLTRADWNGTGQEVDVGTYADEQDLPLNRWPFADSSHLKALVTHTHEFSALSIDVDAALAIDPILGVPAASWEKVNAVDWASRALESALAEVRVAEGHARIDAARDLVATAPEGISTIRVTETSYDHADPEIEATLLDASGKLVYPNSVDAMTARDHIQRIAAPLDQLADRGEWTPYRPGIKAGGVLVITVER